MNTIKFVVVRPTKLTPASSLECQVAPLGKIRTYKPPTRWSKGAKTQFSNQIKNASKELGQGRNHAALSVAFEAGGQWRALFVSETIKTFELHTKLRKHFESALKSCSGETVRLTVSGLTAELQAKVLNAFSSLTTLCTWSPEKYGKGSKSWTQPVARVEIVSDLKESDVLSLCEEGVRLAHGNNLVRTLGTMPSNKLTPGQYRKLLTLRSRQKKFKMTFHDRKALEKMGAGAFLAVTQGSLEDEGGIAHLQSSSAGSRKKLVLVGKGLCFDTGGYNVKTGTYMHGMHTDMIGSAVALALFEAILDAKWDVEVHAFLALAENLISHKAYRPNDVVTALDGTTIEVVDTDAEGRMVLSDTLAMARKLKPDLVLDFATLTGSCIRALDTKRAAIFSPNENLLRLGSETGESCGERAWALPMGDDFNEGLKSEIADVLQCSHIVNADHSFAATFLYRFVGSETPWLHVDLASATSKGGLGLVGSEVTGFGVRWGFEVAKRYFKDVT